MKSLTDGDTEEAMEAVNFLRERLADIVHLYEDTLLSAGCPLPYPDQLTERVGQDGDNTQVSPPPVAALPPTQSS